MSADNLRQRALNMEKPYALAVFEIGPALVRELREAADELDRLRAEVERMLGKIERQRSVAERLQSERDSARRSADALLEAFGYSPTTWFTVATLGAGDTTH